jgi:uncharacterized protein
MKLFLVTFVIMLTVIAMMSIGYIVQRKKIKGSCGGISDLGLEKVCDCDEPCDKRKELIRKMEVERKLEQKLMARQINIKTLEN